ncbi:hypothetical protein V6N11_054384 [Hibiscus sabdariffa]|uniref:Reverse transcriptase zinc-binding domain-containing protein n=1 Tax=Hibiscus sabdariffa TaxID=183260 RepID=A0ABR2S3Y8_9ROSI
MVYVSCCRSLNLVTWAKMGSIGRVLGLATDLLGGVLCAHSTPSELNWKKIVWLGLAPPKFEIFLWSVMQRTGSGEIRTSEKRIIAWSFLQLVKTRLTSWFKAIFPPSSVYVDDVVADPVTADRCSVVKRAPTASLPWCSPPRGFLKHDVDGAMLGDGSAGGMGETFKR